MSQTKFFLFLTSLLAASFFLLFNSSLIEKAAAITPGSSTPFPQINNPVLSPQLRNLSGFEFVQRAVTVGVTLLLTAGAVVFVFMFLIGGIRWITSGGDKAAMEGARGQVTHALIGLAILLSVFAIIQLLGSIFGISLTKLSFPTLDLPKGGEL